MVFGLYLYRRRYTWLFHPAVTPAVIVPHMLRLSEMKLGTGQGVPTLVMASASIDDVFAIILHSTFIGLYTGSSNNLFLQIIDIPISIILGIGLGIVFGMILTRVYQAIKMQDTSRRGGVFVWE